MLKVVCRDELGIIVPFDDHAALNSALMAALEKTWNRSAILAYAHENAWQKRVTVLVEEFNALQAGTLAARAAGKQISLNKGGHLG